MSQPTNSETQDDRINIRLPFMYGIEYDEAEQSTIKFHNSNAEAEISIIDISSIGIQIITDKKGLKEKDKITVFLNFPKKRGEDKEHLLNHEIHGQVKWIQNKITKDQIGITFDDIAEETSILLQKYIDANVFDSK